MEKFWWRAVWGLCLVQLSLAQIQLNVTCRYDGVFHVEKNGRYSISRTEAADLCKAFNCSLPTMAQMEKARKAGFETCRYGFIEGHVVIPRIHPNAICAANHTGVYILTSNTSHYDTYCFNASAPEGHDCASITDLPNAFDGPITISIINSDGSKYIQKGEYRTNPEDINSSNYTNSTEDDMSSGFSSERSTLGDYIFHTHLPTAQPTQDQGNRWEFVTPEETPTTSMDSSLISAGWEPTEEDESDKHPIHSGSGIDDDEDFISSTTTRRVFDDPKQNDNLQQWSPDFLNPEILLQTTTRMTDVDRNVTSDYGEDWTQEPHSTLTRHEHHEEEEAQQSASTTPATPSSATEETATQKEQWFPNRWPGEYPQTPKEDSPSTTGTAVTTASAHDSHPDQRMTTQSQEDSSWTYFFDLISHPMGQGHQTEKTMDMDSSHSTTLQPSADPNTSLVEDLDRIEPFSMTTQQSHTQRLTTSHEGLEEDNDHPMISTPKSSNRNDEGGENLPKDSTTSVEGYTPQSPDTNEYRTFIPVTPAGTGSPGVTEVPVVGNSISNVDGSLSEDHGSSSDPSGRAHTTQGSESAGHSSGSQGGANTTSGPIRKPQIPEWLIILASLLALALILAVCIAVNSRRRCGQKKKLVINNGNGAVEDRKPSGLNGEASKSQEMVHLVNKEPSETPDQFMTADETRNLQNVDMKIGV
ncbi:PREDICTED: CD44 antigen isoform X2 [Hipposideros armiger]|uniref:CD44 antigen n=1 Tax=Hipposideros armiger TaxID=186990 RepID=A0A8B7R1Y9_HIPAR|nr:PREDICTED: CD44 antigen isoform X2 [Hipposideros armiger]